jgi:hypothetical protein
LTTAEAFKGFGGISIGIKSGFCTRTSGFFFSVGLSFGEVGNADYQSSWSAESGGAREGKTCFSESDCDLVTKIGGGSING